MYISKFLDMEAMENTYGKEFRLELERDFKDRFAINDLFKKYKIYRKHYVFMLCSYCGKQYKIKFNNLAHRLRAEFLLEKQPCLGCIGKKKNDVNKELHRLGRSPHLGKPHSEETKRKVRESNIKSGTYIALSAKRKGKSLNDLYGEEKANLIRKQMAENNTRINGTLPPPHTGHLHSEDSKKQMSESRRSFLNSERAEDKNWVSPLTEELVDHKTYRSHVGKYNWAKLSDEERLDRRKNFSSMLSSKLYWKNKTNSGKEKLWYNEEEIFYQSSYEQDYIKMCNRDKVWLGRNKSITLPYTHPKDLEIHYYSPDFIIFKNSSLEKIKSVVEVKPYEFAINPENRNTEYHLVTKAKLDALKKYCKKHNYELVLITEIELYGEVKCRSKRLLK